MLPHSPSQSHAHIGHFAHSFLSTSHASAHVKPSQSPAMSRIARIAIAPMPHSTYQECCFAQVNAILRFACHIFAHVKPCISIPVHTPSIPTPFLHPPALYLAQPSTCVVYRILLSGMFNINAQCYYISTRVQKCTSQYSCTSCCTCALFIFTSFCALSISHTSCPILAH